MVRLVETSEEVALQGLHSTAKFSTWRFTAACTIYMVKLESAFLAQELIERTSNPHLKRAGVFLITSKWSTFCPPSSPRLSSSTLPRLTPCVPLAYFFRQASVALKVVSLNVSPSTQGTSPRSYKHLSLSSLHMWGSSISTVCVDRIASRMYMFFAPTLHSLFFRRDDLLWLDDIGAHVVVLLPAAVVRRRPRLPRRRGRAGLSNQ